jgi:hypothetical protein
LRFNEIVVEMLSSIMVVQKKTIKFSIILKPFGISAKMIIIIQAIKENKNRDKEQHLPYIQL